VRCLPTARWKINAPDRDRAKRYPSTNLSHSCTIGRCSIISPHDWPGRRRRHAPDGVSPASMVERHPSTQITHRKQLHDADVLVNSTSATYRDLGHGRSLPIETRDPRRPWSCGEQSRAPPPLISLIEVTSKLQATQGGVRVGCRGQGDDKSHG
jgi:hypothetical protein